MGVRLWVALDVSDRQAAQTLLMRLGSHRDVKVGMELFYRLGPEYVRSLVESGYHVFLDLKCHDIPHTVARAVEAVQGLGVEMLTIHAEGGFDMLNQARQAAGTLSLVAVTVLTSLNEDALQEVGLQMRVTDLALTRARVAMRAGIAGLVCAGSDIEALRHLWPGARRVVPGIRRPGDSREDQRRVFTPQEARLAGATDIVVGRPITRSPDPAAALAAFMADLR